MSVGPEQWAEQLVIHYSKKGVADFGEEEKKLTNLIKTALKAAMQENIKLFMEDIDETTALILDHNDVDKNKEKNDDSDEEIEVGYPD